MIQIQRTLLNEVNKFSGEIQKNPNNAAAYCNRGIAYYRFGKISKHPTALPNAIDDVNKALQLDPTFHLAYLVRGRAYNALRQYNAAIQDYNTAIQLHPNYGEAYFNRSILYIRRGDEKAYTADFNKALDLGYYEMDG